MPQRFSWIFRNHLAVGAIPSRSSSLYLQDRGITAVLSLTEEKEGDLPMEIRHNFVWQRLPIPDGMTGGIPEVRQFTEGVKTLQRWRQKNNTLYVHCLAGIGRSSSMCIAYVCQTMCIPYEAGLQLVQTTHPVASPDKHQERVLREYLKTCDLG